MAYTPTVWVDGAAAGPFLEATNLNKLEQGVKGAHDLATSLSSRVDEVKRDALSKVEARGFYTPLLASVPIGGVAAFAGANVSGLKPYWLLCDGDFVKKSEYPELWNILGNTWGASNDTWFKLPPKDVFILGSGSKSVGATGGSATHTLTIDEMPAHTHAVGQHSVHTRAATLYKTNATAGTSWDLYSYGSQSAPERLTALSTGGSRAFDLMPPYAVMNIIIRAK